MICGQSDDDEIADAPCAKVCLEGRSDERTVHVFEDDRLVPNGGDAGLYRASRLAFRKHRSRGQRKMAHVKERPVSGTPRREQIRDPLFGVGIVAPSPAGIIEAHLDVDDDQGRVSGERFHTRNRTAPE